MRNITSRRDFLRDAAVGAALGAVPVSAWPQPALPSRPIPGSGERLPIVGFGSTRAADSIGELGTERVAAVVRALVASGGRVVDTWPREEANVAAFGSVLSAPDLRDSLFVTVNIAREERAAGRAQFDAALRAYGRDSIDLVNVGSLIGLAAQWPNLQEWRAAGRARYIGVTAAQATLYEQLETFLRRETPDFVEINYSVTERQAEERLLPMLADRGIAVLVSRPFMNGAYFERLASRPLPEWTAEFECRSWAQFSLQYIFGNPAVTCVLTETTSPQHMTDNAQSALAPSPDIAGRQRMRALIDSI